MYRVIAKFEDVDALSVIDSENPVFRGICK